MNTRRWMWLAHKWVGIVACVFMLAVSVSALFLNHPEWLPAEQARSETQSGLNPQQITTLAVDPFDPRHIVASDERGLYQSHDQGQNWQPLELFVPAEKVNHIAFFPDQKGHLLISLKESGLYFSEDGGDIWDELALPFKPIAGEYIQALAVGAKGHLQLKTKQGLYVYSPTGGWQHAQARAVSQVASAQSTWSDWMYDLHTGQILGSYGRSVYDGAAIAFIFLSLSGLYLSWRFKSRRTKTTAKLRSEHLAVPCPPPVSLPH